MEKRRSVSRGTHKPVSQCQDTSAVLDRKKHLKRRKNETGKNHSRAAEQQLALWKSLYVHVRARRMNSHNNTPTKPAVDLAF